MELSFLWSPDGVKKKGEMGIFFSTGQRRIASWRTTLRGRARPDRGDPVSVGELSWRPRPGACTFRGADAAAPRSCPEETSTNDRTADDTLYSGHASVMAECMGSCLRSKDSPVEQQMECV
jgi:hypothetical protein